MDGLINSFTHSRTHKISTMIFFLSLLLLSSHWGAADAEIKVPSVERTQSLKVLPLKPGVGQYIVIHATLTARDFFLANFYPSGPFTCILKKNLSSVFPVLAVAVANTS